MKRFAFAGAVGAAFAYFFDPDNGRKRRKELIKRAAQRFQSRRDLSQPDDATLAREVESEIFSGADVTKGQIDVAVEDGVVYLRGELDQPDLIEDLETQARKVVGVRDVENLLLVSGQEAPAKAE